MTKTDAADQGTINAGPFTLPYRIEGTGHPTIVIGSALYYPRVFRSRGKHSASKVGHLASRQSLHCSERIPRPPKTPRTEYSLNCARCTHPNGAKCLNADSL